MADPHNIDELARIQAKLDDQLKQLDELRRANPHLFRAIEDRFRKAFNYHGDISTEELFDFALEHHYSLVTGEPIQ